MYSKVPHNRFSVKELLLDLARYNAWADKRLLDAILALPGEIPDRPVLSSFPTLTATFTHLLWAETTWLRRLKLQENILQDEDFRGKFPELSTRLQSHHATLVQWIDGQEEVFFSHVIAYYNSKKHHFKMPVSECLTQLLNHGTYHRGQVVTMLRELAVSSIPGTDYIVFKRLAERG